MRRVERRANRRARREDPSTVPPEPPGSSESDTLDLESNKCNHSTVRASLFHSVLHHSRRGHVFDSQSTNNFARGMAKRYKISLN